MTVTPVLLVCNLILFEPSYNLTPVLAVNKARLASASSITTDLFDGVVILREPVPT